MVSGKGETYLGYLGERALALEHGVDSRHMDQSVSFGNLTALAASHLNTLHFRTPVERMHVRGVVVTDHEACKMRVGTRVHVKHLDIPSHNTLRRTARTACHHRPTPCHRIQALGRSKQGLVVILIHLQKVIVVPNLNDIPELRTRPDNRVCLSRDPENIVRVMNDLGRVDVLTAALQEIQHLQRRPRESRLVFLRVEDHDAPRVRPRLGSGEGLEVLA